MQNIFVFVRLRAIWCEMGSVLETQNILRFGPKYFAFVDVMFKPYLQVIIWYEKRQISAQMGKMFYCQLAVLSISYTISLHFDAGWLENLCFENIRFFRAAESTRFITSVFFYHWSSRLWCQCVRNYQRVRVSMLGDIDTQLCTIALNDYL